MALSGSLSTAYRGWTYRIEWSASQSVANNTSTVTCRHYLDCKKTYSLYINTRENTCTVGGDSKEYTSPKISNDGAGAYTLLMGTTTHVVTHNSDGTLSTSISGVFNLKSTLSGTYKANISVSGTIALDTIPRASQPSCITWPEHTQNVGEFGDTISIHMNRKSSSFTHTVRYAFGSSSGTIATGVGTGTTWTIPLSLMSLIPIASKGSGTIYVDTYNGSTLVGTKSCGFTATVPDEIKPIIKSVQVLDATGIKDTYGDLVKGKSKLNVKITAEAPYSKLWFHSVKLLFAGIDEVKVYRVSPKEIVTTDVLEHAGTVTVRASVYDLRDSWSGNVEHSFSVLDYVKPSITSLTVHRCAQDGTEDDQGEYIQVTFSAAVTPLNNKNSAVYTLRYKKSGADTDTEVPLADLTGDYSVTDYSYIFAADSDFSYDVTVEVKDDFNTSPLSTSASTAFTLMDWNDDGKSLAFGKVSEESGTLENALILRQMGNTYCYSSIGAANTDGYILIARIEITATNADSPITFTLSRRKALATMTVHVTFKATDNLTPGLESVTYEGENYGAFIVQLSDSIWGLYVQKVNQSDTVTLNRWTTSYRQMKRCALTFPGTIVTALPQPYYRATPAKLRSILDYIYPVGSIYLSYSHVSPAELFGGTWERIQNAFLWAVDEDGAIGLTGGEKTHTLTVNEMPSHSHGSVYSQHADGTKDKAWYSTSGSSVAYGAVATGGGAAHNNMPPYIQVSAWRRTA